VWLPGNGGGGDIRDCNFYGWAEAQLKQGGYDVRLPEGGMPDPLRARESKWIPYILDTLQCDENTVLIGHSSGAGASMVETPTPL
jgi:predicted alpha/beta hydrolase family esterase